MAESSTIYVDQHFFMNNMGEKDEYNSYQAKIVAVKVDWLRGGEGTKENMNFREFLLKIQKGDNLSFYKVSYLRIIIEFLYLKLKVYLQLVFLPIFLIMLIDFLALIFIIQSYVA